MVDLKHIQSIIENEMGTHLIMASNFLYPAEKPSPWRLWVDGDFFTFNDLGEQIERSNSLSQEDALAAIRATKWWYESFTALLIKKCPELTFKQIIGPYNTFYITEDKKYIIHSFEFKILIYDADNSLCITPTTTIDDCRAYFHLNKPNAVKEEKEVKTVRYIPCPSCQAEIDDLQAEFCPKCGIRLNAPPVFIVPTILDPPKQPGKVPDRLIVKGLEIPTCQNCTHSTDGQGIRCVILCKKFDYIIVDNYESFSNVSKSYCIAYKGSVKACPKCGWYYDSRRCPICPKPNRNLLGRIADFIASCLLCLSVTAIIAIAITTCF